MCLATMMDIVLEQMQQQPIGSLGLYTGATMHEDDAVWYDILAFSRPNHFLARLGYPLVRRLQKRFARDSASAIKNVVKSIA